MRKWKDPIPEEKFIPDYLGTRQKIVIEKSMEQQRQEWKDFKEKYKAALGKT